jgi:glycosyltransferase involved in cell wall biosynthesis
MGGEDVHSRIEIAKKFMDIGFSVKILGTEDKNIFSKNKIEYIKYNFNREFGVLNDLKTLLSLREILKKFPNRTIVHAFDTKPTIFLPLSSIGLDNIKVVRTITGMGRVFTDNTIKNRILRAIYNQIQLILRPFVDFTIFQNIDDAKYFYKHHLVSKKKSQVIKSSGIDIEKFNTKVDILKVRELIRELDIDVKKRTFILISRMVKQKGILDYLEACKICYEEGFYYNFLLVGQLDTDKSITLEDIQKYKKYVKYLGRREDIRELLTISDVFVLPTYYREGVPRVLLEASVIGLGLIATDMPGCRDVVVDEYNGKLVNPKDPKDLSSKMIYLAEDRERLRRFKQNSKLKVQEFTLDRVATSYANIYKSILNKNNRSLKNVESSTI